MLCNQLWQWVDAAVVADKTGNVCAASCVCMPFDASINRQKASRGIPTSLARGVSGSFGKGCKGREIPFFQRGSVGFNLTNLNHLLPVALRMLKVVDPADQCWFHWCFGSVGGGE
ncbi:MAG: hypothetical protein ACK459_04160 [Akkermansiaceae bacterium]